MTRADESLRATSLIARAQATSLIACGATSYRQALASLGATGAEDGLAAARLLAYQKAVGSLSAADGRLVGAFHD